MIPQIGDIIRTANPIDIDFREYKVGEHLRMLLENYEQVEYARILVANGEWIVEPRKVKDST